MMSGNLMKVSSKQACTRKTARGVTGKQVRMQTSLAAGDLTPTDKSTNYIYINTARMFFSDSENT